MKCWLIAGLCLAAGCVNHVQATTPATQPVGPRVFQLDPNYLQSTRQKIRGGDKSFDRDLAGLRRDAVRAMREDVYTVMDKDATPPSGDKHDYMSQARYFWPDPKKPNGLPYISRDGQVNPEINKIPDHNEVAGMTYTVQTLAMAYYYTGDETYAARATLLLRTWFLNADTKMNPNMNFAQYVPGVNDGRGIGLIETRGFADLVDAIGLLGDSKSWTPTDQADLQKWFADYWNWLQTSPNGKDESHTPNNHGTFYDVQLTSIALFLGKEDFARKILQQARSKHIATQIEPDGRQTLELARTRAWTYSTMNLDGLTKLAMMGDRVGVDLWHYETSDDRGIKKAIDWLMPFYSGEQKWRYQQIDGGFGENFDYLLVRAAEHYPDPKYRELLTKSRGGRDVLFDPPYQN